MEIKIEESEGKKKYWLNGVPYDRVEDIPEEFREHFIDKNNNGIPDQFDSMVNAVGKMKGGASLLQGVFEAAKGIKSSSPSSTNVKGYPPEMEKSSIFPILMKITISAFITVLIVWLYLRWKKPEIPTQQDPEGIVEHTDSVKSQINNKIIFAVEDPNQPPHRMLGVVYRNGVKYFSFQLPDGELGESNDSTLQVFMDVTHGTNLEESTFSLSVNEGECPTGELSSTISIGEIEFTKREYGESGAGQRYQSYQYSFEKDGKCFSFLLMLHSGNPEVYDPPVKEYDPQDQLSQMEKTLGTISSY